VILLPVCKKYTLWIWICWVPFKPGTRRESNSKNVLSTWRTWCWNHLSNTQAPFNCMLGTISRSYMHLLIVCLEPFLDHTGTVYNYMAGTICQTHSHTPFNCMFKTVLYGWNHLSNTKAPFNCMLRTICPTHRHLLIVCWNHLSPEVFTHGSLDWCNYSTVKIPKQVCFQILWVDECVEFTVGGNIKSSFAMGCQATWYCSK
jgi:hypothetical protein